MKDKIHEIIQKHENQTDSADWDASEIADMVKAFTEWLKNESEVMCGSKGYFLYWTNKYYIKPPTTFTFDELFNYWFDNIREK